MWGGVCDKIKKCGEGGPPKNDICLGGPQKNMGGMGRKRGGKGFPEKICSGEVKNRIM